MSVASLSTLNPVRLQKADLPQAFQVSVQLSKILAQRVAALVMIIIIAMPLLTFTPDDLSPQAFVEIFNLFAQVHACEYGARART